MNTAFSDIRAALETTMNSIGGVIAWENAEFEPDVGTDYVRPTLLPGDTVQAGAGANGLDLHRGLLQVDIFSRAGTDPVTTTPDAIATAFKRGSTHTFNGVDVRIEATSQQPARREGAWWIVPVIIRYFCHTAPRS